MTALRLRDSGAHEPSPIAADRPRRPYPNGWFALAFGEQVPAGGVLRTRFMGEDLVVYRTRAGIVRVVEPYCPHLGAHLGYGGTIEGEEIICPFHRFAFDVDGACVRSGYGTRPPAARLRQRTVRERNGAIMVWRHAAGAPPEWELPDLPTGEFPAPVRHAYTIVDHPQEIVENAVDVGHIGPIHHYTNVRVRQPLALDGPRLRIGPAGERVFPLLGDVDVIFDVEAHGLGYIWVRATIPRLQAAALFQAMATPIDPCRVTLRFSVAVRTGIAQRAPSGRSLLLSRALTVGLAPAFWRDLRRDFPIWENKAYVERPRLAKGDGPIGAFRRWADQFYAGCDDAAARSASLDRDGTKRPATPSSTV
ncbi:MAG TPA: Rieske 2Fe-2S domain-containing protein [Conexibacter sp.]|nr:Rieske 2Fe-2S domain-containing protein [Conexibacter sp.]